jgi:DNA gyrase subunit B
MKELIDAGYLYIAQPPLFKLKKGKSERYIKDERSLEEHLLELALENVEVSPAGRAAALDSAMLRGLLQRASDYRAVLERLELRRLDSRVIDAAVAAGAPREADFVEEAALRGRIAGAIDDKLRLFYPNLEPLAWATSPDPEHGGFRLVASARRAGVAYQTALDTEFIRSADYQRLAELSAEIARVGAGPFRVSRPGDAQLEEISSPVALLEYLLKLGEKGLTIQRYKGLGEMNPDQLADTTLNPQHRTLLQVRVPDAVEADLAFTTLMGDDVEPRREFIERNALEVQNLDI